MNKVDILMSIYNPDIEYLKEQLKSLNVLHRKKVHSRAADQ